MSNHSEKRRPAALARVGRGLAIAALAGLLSACVQQPKSMYSWQSYQGSVYAYLKDDGADYATQTLALEKNIETARASNTELPPGFRAHLGMLYMKMGNGDKGAEQMLGEKEAFPESAPFMDFLLRNAGKPAAQQAAVGTPGVGTPGVATPGAAASNVDQAAPAQAAESKKGS